MEAFGKFSTQSGFLTLFLKNDEVPFLGIYFFSDLRICQVKGEILPSTGMKRKAPVRRFTFKETRDGFGTLGGVAVANEENLFSHTKANGIQEKGKKKNFSSGQHLYVGIVYNSKVNYFESNSKIIIDQFCI